MQGSRFIKGLDPAERPLGERQWKCHLVGLGEASTRHTFPWWERSWAVLEQPGRGE